MRTASTSSSMATGAAPEAPEPGTAAAPTLAQAFRRPRADRARVPGRDRHPARGHGRARGRGYVLLVMLLALPFCTPIPLPGLSTAVRAGHRPGRAAAVARPEALAAGPAAGHGAVAPAFHEGLRRGAQDPARLRIFPAAAAPLADGIGRAAATACRAHPPRGDFGCSSPCPFPSATCCRPSASCCSPPACSNATDCSPRRLRGVCRGGGVFRGARLRRGRGVDAVKKWLAA